MPSQDSVQMLPPPGSLPWHMSWAWNLSFGPRHTLGSEGIGAAPLTSTGYLWAIQLYPRAPKIDLFTHREGETASAKDVFYFRATSPSPLLRSTHHRGSKDPKVKALYLLQRRLTHQSRRMSQLREQIQMETQTRNSWGSENP